MRRKLKRLIRSRPLRRASFKRVKKRLAPMRRRRSSRVRYAKRGISRTRRGARGFLSGTTGKLLTGGIIGGVTAYLTSRFSPNLAVLADDAGDLASTFIAGKWGLVGNVIGKRALPVLVNQGFSGGNGSSGDSA